MVTATLETSCLIALEKPEEPEASWIKALVQMHRKQVVRLRVLASSQSERKRVSSYGDFEKRLAALGLQDLDVLLPCAIWDMTYWGRSKWCDDAILRNVSAALFPGMPFDWHQFVRSVGIDPSDTEKPDTIKVRGKWQNRLCDVLALASHIDEGGGVFVTSDKHFLKRSKELLALGAEVLTPEQTVMRFSMP